MSTGGVSRSIKMEVRHNSELPWTVKVANRDSCFATAGLALQVTVQAEIAHG